MPKNHTRQYSQKKGVALLPMVLSLSFVILVMVVSLASLGFIEISIGTASKRADEAFFIANSGISDAIMLIVRDKDYSSTGYSFAIGNGSVTVVVEKNVPVTGQSRIISTGTVNSSQRKIQADVTVDSYGKVTLSNFTEIAP